MPDQTPPPKRAGDVVPTRVTYNSAHHKVDATVDHALLIVPMPAPSGDPGARVACAFSTATPEQMAHLTAAAMQVAYDQGELGFAFEIFLSRMRDPTPTSSIIHRTPRQGGPPGGSRGGG